MKISSNQIARKRNSLNGEIGYGFQRYKNKRPWQIHFSWSRSGEYQATLNPNPSLQPSRTLNRARLISPIWSTGRILCLICQLYYLYFSLYELMFPILYCFVSSISDCKLCREFHLYYIIDEDPILPSITTLWT